MKKNYLGLLFIFLLFSLQSFSLNFTENKKIEELFNRNNVKGTFVLYDVENNKFEGYNKERSNERFYPASTFKIYNSLIGLEAGAVKNVDETFYKYSGEKVFLQTWAQDSNLRYAIKVSQVPAYQLLAKKIGMKKMQEEINKLNFGNKELGKEIDQFWLKGPLKISAIEQCILLAKLGKSELPYSKEIQKQIQDITVLDSGKGWTLHGKTGWATSNIEVPIGWFVGWVEKEGKIYSFAINLDMKNSDELPKREAVAKEALKILEIL